MHCSIRSTLLLVVFYFSIILLSTFIGNAIGQQNANGDIKPWEIFHKGLYAKLVTSNPKPKNSPLTQYVARQFANSPHETTTSPSSPIPSISSPPSPLSLSSSSSPPTSTTISKTQQQSLIQKQNYTHIEAKSDLNPSFSSIDQSDEDSILSGISTDMYTISPNTKNSSVLTRKTKQKFSETDLNSQQSTNIHPLLIYSIRYEIRSYDLYNFPSLQQTKSQVANLNTANTHYNAQSFNGNQPIFTSQASSSSAQSIVFDQQLQHQQHHFNNKHSKTLMAGLKNTIGLDFYYSDSESFIFWTDVNEERIYKGTIINATITNLETIVQSGLATAEGLAVDWIGLNIYWVESTLDHIEVANMNGTFRRTLIAGDMESPRAIAVDPRYGLLFWSDWDKKSPRIERATMSGEDRKTLVYIKEVQGGWPNGLTLDYDQSKIYWIDANSDSIHVVDYEGNNHQQILEQIKSLGHPFSITLFKDNLYWTDWKTNSISMANKYTGSDVKELQKLTNRLFDIKVFHPSRQPKIDDKLNPCFINNGNCSHLCLLSYNHTRECQCPSLMKLDIDYMTCIPSEKVLLIGRNNEIRAVDIFKPLNHVMAPISVPKVFIPKQFEFYAKTKTIYWADSQTNEVKRIQLSGTSIDTIIDVIVESPSGLALDWISGNIYVTSSMQNNIPGKIYISNLEGEYISILMDNNSNDLLSPKSIAVHPILGLLFCVDEGGGENSIEPIIFKASMDGTNKQIITSKAKNPKLDNPMSLSIDYETNKLYWINQANDSWDNASIQYYDIMKDIVVTLLDEKDMASVEKINPTALSVDGDSLIVGARKRLDAIIRISTNDISNRTILRTQNLEQLSALKVYNSSTQVGENACSFNNGNCSQLCIPSNVAINNTFNFGRTCKCTMGYTNNPLNSNECLGKDLFLIYSYNLGMKGISLEPNSSADDYYLPPIHRAFRASSIDFVHKDNLIYWVDNEEGSITRINRDTTNYKLIVQGLESEESIAIDWIAGNLYWLDPYYDIIEVARLNGTNRYVIVSGDMEKPNGIVVNPIKGYLAWSDVGTYPRIEVAQLDGSNRKVIVNSSISHVDDLAIDYTEDYIYWIDSNLALIECVKPDGSNRQVIYNSSSYNQLVSIAIYKQYLYIANSVQSHGSIIRCNKKNMQSIFCEEIIHNLGEGIRDIAIFAEQPMPNNFDENPCMLGNGGCQDLCLFMGKPNKKRCICSHGKLASDELSCKPYDTFVLFSKLSEIDSLHISEEISSNNSPYLPITMENRSNIISLTVDYNNQRVIYSDMIRDQICSVFFNGTERKVLIEKQSLVEGIAFDNNQLYWTSIHDFSISRLNVTSSGVLTNPSCSVKNSCEKSIFHVEKIVRLSNDDKPRGIAVDVCTSYVYWTNWNSNASIQRASPHNGYKVESIIKTNIKVPNGITIDQSLRKLYWCDAKIDKIEACDMDGSNRVVLILALPQHPFAISIWDNYVFWTDWLARGVFKADKYTGLHPVQIKKVAQRPMGIAVAAPQNVECPIDHCMTNNGGCPAETICVMHYPGHKSTGIVDCRARSQLITDQPIARCKHSRNGASCDTLSYHDIIVNSMERYNMTDLNPIESSKKNYPTFVPTESTTSMTIETTTNYMIPRSNDHFDNIDQQERITSTNETFTKAINNPTTLSPAIPNITISDNKTTNIDDIISITTSTTTTTTMAPVTTLDLSTEPTTKGKNNSTVDYKLKLSPSTISNESQALNQTTLPPCQISPAALQTTSSTDACKQSEFKCYLSEKLLCIPSERRCDGNHDCPSKEDENDCYLSKMGPSYNLKRESNWHRFVTVILVILGAAVAALFLVFGSKGRRRWFVSNEAFNHTRMFDINETTNFANTNFTNPLFDDEQSSTTHCAFSIDLNETTNFSNPLYERQVLLINDKHSTSKAK